MPFKAWTAALALALTCGTARAASPADDQWQGKPPAEADKPEIWAKLVPELMDRGLYFGALAASRAMLNFFADLTTKELAYKTITKLTDLGYPFSTRNLFIPGDLDQSGPDAFAQSYLLYKGIVNLDKSMPKWAEYYFTRLDPRAPKYLFFRATQAYAAKKLDEATGLLKQGLAATNGPESVNLAKKQARTLARIYYEQGEYAKSLEIYQSFLLKTDPLVPTDWLESAWSLYQLKRHDEALGALYNLEAKSTGEPVPLEKFLLRGLIYREYCAIAATKKLVDTFQAQFGATIDGIKMGEPLAKFGQLRKIAHPDAERYRQYGVTLARLGDEAGRVKRLPAKLRGLADYVYRSETEMLRRGRQYHEDRALEALAKHLVILGESLRFLQFDVTREKFSPDRVFAEVTAPPPKLIETDDTNYRLHWVQWGDYWRDERALYRGLVKTKCDR